jgi:hypothetical protein
VLGTQVDAHVIVVRDVAPQKVMLCAMFRLPESVCYAETTPTKRKSTESDDGVTVEEPNAKKSRTDSQHDL